MNLTILMAATWLIPVFVLLVLSRIKFNSPPTNRSRTTWFLFNTGWIVYFVLLLGVWFLVLHTIRGVSFSIDSAGQHSTEIDAVAPAISMLLVILSSYYKKVERLDRAARKLAIRVAAVPRERDRLAAEIRSQADFRIESKSFKKEIEREAEEKGVSLEKLDFDGEQRIETLITMAIALYTLFFKVPKRAGTTQVDLETLLPKKYRKSIAMHSGDLENVQNQYDKFIREAAKYSEISHPDANDMNRLTEAANDVIGAFLHILSEVVLECDILPANRYSRLKSFGFHIENVLRHPSIHHYTALAISIVVIFTVILSFTRDTEIVPVIFQSLRISIMMAIAVFSGVEMAYKSINVVRAAPDSFPPFGWFVLAGVVAVGLSVLFRLFYVVPAYMGEMDVLSAFGQSWQSLKNKLPWQATIFVLAVGVAGVCTYVGVRERFGMAVWFVAALGLVLCMMLGASISQAILVQYYPLAAPPRLNVLITSATIGCILGIGLPWLFRKSIEDAER